MPRPGPVGTDNSKSWYCSGSVTSSSVRSSGPNNSVPHVSLGNVEKRWALAIVPIAAFEHRSAVEPDTRGVGDRGDSARLVETARLGDLDREDIRRARARKRRRPFPAPARDSSAMIGIVEAGSEACERGRTFDGLLREVTSGSFETGKSLVRLNFAPRHIDVDAHAGSAAERPFDRPLRAQRLRRSTADRS